MGTVGPAVPYTRAIFACPCRRVKHFQALSCWWPQCPRVASMQGMGSRGPTPSPSPHSCLSNLTGGFLRPSPQGLHLLIGGAPPRDQYHVEASEADDRDEEKASHTHDSHAGPLRPTAEARTRGPHPHCSDTVPWSPLA